MSSSLLHGVPVEVEVAIYRIDTSGRLYCDDCTPRYPVDIEREITKPFNECTGGPDHVDNCCDTCGRNPWASRKTVIMFATVEYPRCKIF